MGDALMTAKVLLRAAEIVEEGWCQRHYAVDIEGRECPALSPNAARWCVYGALDRACAEIGVARYSYDSAVSGVATATWQDMPGRTAEEVAAKLREAAQHAEGVR